MSSIFPGANPGIPNLEPITLPPYPAARGKLASPLPVLAFSSDYEHEHRLLRHLVLCVDERELLHGAPPAARYRVLRLQKPSVRDDIVKEAASARPEPFDAT